MRLVVALPEVRAPSKIIGVDEGSTFVPEQTPDSVSVLDGPVRSFLQGCVSTCMNTENTSRLTQYLVPIPLALAVAICPRNLANIVSLSLPSFGHPKDCKKLVLAMGEMY